MNTLKVESKIQNILTVYLFKILALFTSLLCFYIFYLLFKTPENFLSDVGVTGSEAAYFVARRAAMLMLGVSVLMFFSRNLQNGQARQAIALSLVVTMSSLALLGSYEFSRGFVNEGIIGAIIIESMLAMAFFTIWFVNRRETQVGNGQAIDT
ncbi:hypothetical protein [Colwellia psychrerythraea]|uniref:DUF4345 domain-containing protein n=1 Tax=Colwellia psychrerythraea TaxID=28229 RepID=A0A099K8X4_COLPS|nr:hypothetical protein [Colwellia psychrerythraea]KGJ86821.1 hypothetical protein GAB14E_4648 [Colwellia psychrerythraea]